MSEIGHSVTVVVSDTSTTPMVIDASDNRTEAEKLEDKIESIINEFADRDPVGCIAIIAERIALRRHYRQFPNAPREDAYA